MSAKGKADPQNLLLNGGKVPNTARGNRGQILIYPNIREG